MASDSKVWAFIAYLLSIVGFILVLALKKKDKFAMYHAKQSLILFVIFMAGYVILMFIPVLGEFLMIFLGVFFIIWTIMGIINALTGKTKPLPIIGGLAQKIKI